MKNNSPILETPDYYKLTVENTLKTLKSSKTGISTEDSDDRKKIYGLNKLQSLNKQPLIFKFFRQFRDLMVIILIASGSFSLYLKEYRDAVIMFTIVLLNASIGFFQEYKAEKIMNSLKQLVQAKAKVLRDGKTYEVKQSELVPGDIVCVEEGDSVPADLRVIEENSLSTNDFALTGESNPTRKFTHPINGNVQLGDRNNLIFMGTIVATGNGKGVVIHTGMNTEVGKIANLSQETKADASPLQKEMQDLAKRISIITLAIAFSLTIIGLLLKFSLRESILFGIGIAASCVPEGLPAQVSVALSLAAGRLGKKNAVVKQLSAVETLGDTHIICTDKTGTLTKNEMTVQKLFLSNTEFAVTGTGYQPEGNIVKNNNDVFTEEDLKKYSIFFETGAFASNAKVNPPDADHKDWYCIGDPTEAALITLANKAKLDPQKLDLIAPEIKEFSFDAVRKRMSSIRKHKNIYTVYIKGSPQSVLERCTKIFDNGTVRDISADDKEKINKKDDEYANSALRVLAYAYKELPNYTPDITMEQAESDLVFLGLAAMIDPPRDDVKDAMEAALKAKIRVIIITGDYALTAEAIAKKIGLNSQNDKEITVINGEHLKEMSDIELLHNLMNENLIFSRTSPEDKLRIVKLLKKAGEIVAVTGDGVNDAPALKKADIGVAMGRTGTDVAKDASSIVLLDDSFSTLVLAIKEGRTIFNNLKNTIVSSLTSNFGELFAVLFSIIGTSLLGWPLSILAVQILAIDLIGEMLPLTFLTWDKAQPEIMKEVPRNPEQHIIDSKTILKPVLNGALMGILGYANFLFIFYRENINLVNVDVNSSFYFRATALTYVTIVLCQWVNIMNNRTMKNETIFTKYIYSNKRLLFSYLISLFFILNIIYNPLISSLLRTAPLNLIDWLLCLGCAFIYLIIKELQKSKARSKQKKDLI